MKTLMILPTALILLAVSCKKADDLPAPLQQQNLLQHTLPIDYYAGSSTVISTRSSTSNEAVHSASWRSIGIRENGQDLFEPDPNLHPGNGTPIRLPYQNALITNAVIPMRKGGDLPPRRPNNWEKAPGPISAY